MTDRSDRYEAARAIVLANGSSATSYQILNPGIAHWFGRGADAVVGYVDHGRFRVVAGQPVCSDDRMDAALDEFERDTRALGLGICYFGAESAMLARRQGAAYSAIRLGAQPVWEPSGWTEIVRERASLRAQLHRARNKGVVVREWPVAGLSDASALQGCLEEWLATRHMPPMHFLVEPNTLGQLVDRRLFVAEREGATIGFLVASPVPRRSGWLIEQIIRGRGAVNGTSELLVDAAMHALSQSGSRYVTLGMSPLSRRSHAGDLAHPLWLRLLLGWVRAHGRRFYNFEGLDSFKAKLGPDAWEPLYAITDSRRFPPEALLAIAGVFTAGAPVVSTLRALGWALAEEARLARSAVRPKT